MKKINFYVYYFLLIFVLTLKEVGSMGGTKNWCLFAHMLNGKVQEQCMKRWHNHLKLYIKVFFVIYLFFLAQNSLLL